MKTVTLARLARTASVLAVACFGMSQAAAQTSAELTRSMGIQQHLGDEVPRDVPFKDEAGKAVHFGDYLGQRPVLVLPIFYKCQTGCALITDGLIKTLAKASHPSGMGAMFGGGSHKNLRLGRDLDVVMVSIDPRETPELAGNKKALIMDAYNPNLEAGVSEHWHLLTGKLADIRRLTDALGFKYYFNPKNGIIRHPTASMILTPNGRISSYTIGNDFPTKILEDGVELAAQNRIGVTADQSFMFGCVMLDPATGKIRIVVENLVRIGGVLTLLVLGGFITKMTLEERRKNLPGGHPTGA